MAGTSTVPVWFWKLLKSTWTEIESPVTRVTWASGPTTDTAREVVAKVGSTPEGAFTT